jgi:hypothetical protein
MYVYQAWPVVNTAIARNTKKPGQRNVSEAEGSAIADQSSTALARAIPTIAQRIKSRRLLAQKEGVFIMLS